MKRKLILFTTTLLCLTSSVAETGKGYRIINEETHSTPGFNFQVEHVTPGTAESLKKNSSGRTSTRVPSKSGKINQSITVDGNHDFSINNTTGKPQLYELNVSLDCEAFHGNHKRHVELHSGGYYFDSYHSFGTVQKANTGIYKISGETKLGGESKDSSRDSNSLYINK